MINEKKKIILRVCLIIIMIWVGVTIGVIFFRMWLKNSFDKAIPKVVANIDSSIEKSMDQKHKTYTKGDTSIYFIKINDFYEKRKLVRKGDYLFMYDSNSVLTDTAFVPIER